MPTDFDNYRKTCRDNPGEFTIKCDYERQIRGPDGEIYTEKYLCVWEEYDDVLAKYCLLERSDASEAGIFKKRNLDADFKDVLTMPDWWCEPANRDTLSLRYKEDGQNILPSTNNVVTFATYMSNGQIQLQQRGFVSPAGEEIADPGKLSINGGLMKSDDVEAELARNALKELGIDDVTIDDYNAVGTALSIGDIYDADNGRCNHVFVINNYDAALKEFSFADDAVDALTTVEGVGRAFVWREDWDAAVQAGMVTDISVAIMDAFPDLLPLPRPSDLGGIDGLI